MALAQRRTAVAASRLHLVAPSKAVATPAYSPLSLWHLLSLDAPTVAAVWTVFIAWSAGVPLSWADPLAMFTAVWILYAADRLLDAKPLVMGNMERPNSPGTKTFRDFQDLEALQALEALENFEDLEERHHFHHRHRRRFLPLLIAATVPLALLLHLLPAPVLHGYVLLAALLAGWLLLVHARPGSGAGARRLPKELAVGVFFPAAVGIPTLARAPGICFALLPDVLLFAGVCTLNCLFLYLWEHPGDRSRAHATTRFATGHPLPITGLLLAACAAWAVLPSAFIRTRLMEAGQLHHPSTLPLACLLSTGLFLLLHAIRRHFSALHLRALADLVLLTPMLLLAWSQIAR